MSGHTPGPWFIDKNSVYALDETNRVNRFSVRIDGGYVVYSTHTHIPRVRTSQAEIEANARLIASAPDIKADNDRLRAVNAELLGALETIQAAFLSGDDSGHEWFIHDDGTLQEAIVSVIAKARGAS